MESVDIKVVRPTGDAIVVKPPPCVSEFVCELRARLGSVLDLHEGRVILLLDGNELMDDQKLVDLCADVTEPIITVVTSPCLARPSEYGSYILQCGVENYDSSVGYVGGRTVVKGYDSIEHMTFPEPKDININMMPFLLGKIESLPEEYHQYWPMIEKCEGSLKREELGKVVFLTITEGLVEPGHTQRRGGLHIDSPGILKLGGKYAVQYHHWGRGVADVEYFEGGIFLASSVQDSCMVWDVCLRQPQEIAGSLGDVEHLRDLLGDGHMLGSGELVWVTDTTPHESLPLAEATYRQFFRLVTSSVSVWYEKNSTANRLGIQPDLAVTMIIKDDKFASHKRTKKIEDADVQAWGCSLQEWIIDLGCCTAAALALKDDGVFFAAAPSEGGVGMAAAFSDDHEESILMADGTATTKVIIDEAGALIATVSGLRAPPQGLWLGGKKFHVVQSGRVEACERDLKWLLAMSVGKRGVHIITTNSLILACFFEGEHSGHCKMCSVEYATWLAEQGY